MTRHAVREGAFSAVRAVAAVSSELGPVDLETLAECIDLPTKPGAVSFRQ